jgi:translation initiation factor eIF-2B subunit epsilon
MKPGSVLDGIKYCWGVGQKMIEQFDAQESSEEESDEEESDEE